MPNRVIVKSKKVEEVNRDGVELRRINAILEHKDVSEDELKHYGVIGQKWGIRKDFEANKSIRKSRAKMLRTKRLMSDDEMAKTVKRLEMEKKLTQLVADDVVPGRVLVSSQMGKFMSSALGAAAGVVGAVIVKEALKSAGLKGD